MWHAQMYGSSGYLERPGNSTLAAYTACYPRDHIENHHIKTIANLAYVESVGGDPHHFTYKVCCPLNCMIVYLCHNLGPTSHSPQPRDSMELSVGLQQAQCLHGEHQRWC